MTNRRIGCERLCFELTLLLVERKGVMGKARFTLSRQTMPRLVFEKVKEKKRRRRRRRGEMRATEGSYNEEGQGRTR